MFKSSGQVQRIVKKIAKHRALLAVHLSDTPCLKSDEELHRYISIKLRLRQPLSEDQPQMSSPFK